MGVHYYILQERDYQTHNPANAIDGFSAISDAEAVQYADANWANWRETAVLKRVSLIDVTPPGGARAE